MSEENLSPTHDDEIVQPTFGGLTLEESQALHEDSSQNADRIEDVDKARAMAYAEKPGQEYAAAMKEKAKIIGDAVVNGKNFDSVVEESIPHAAKTHAITIGALTTEGETWNEERERVARTNIVNVDATPARMIRDHEKFKTMDERLDDVVKNAKDELGNAQKTGEAAGERYDAVKEKIDSIK
jgi:hypothetical protein